MERQTVLGNGDRSITYLPLAKGFLNLAAILDWATRRVLAWRLSNTLSAPTSAWLLWRKRSPATARLRSSTPTKGCQFTSEAFTGVLKHHGIRISMDGRGRCHDNIFVERLWWTGKHEWVYLHPAANGIEQKKSLAAFFDWYNRRRPHQALGWKTPDEAYFGQQQAALWAA